MSDEQKKRLLKWIGWALTAILVSLPFPRSLDWAE
jgi:hypothetical protein